MPQFYQPPAIILNSNVMNAAGVRTEETKPLLRSFDRRPRRLGGLLQERKRDSGGTGSRLGHGEFRKAIHQRRQRTKGGQALGGVVAMRLQLLLD